MLVIWAALHRIFKKILSRVTLCTHVPIKPSRTRGHRRLRSPLPISNSSSTETDSRSRIPRRPKPLRGLCIDSGASFSSDMKHTDSGTGSINFLNFKSKRPS
ncbi:hypothetical protein I3843_02G040000 [Carya illinoinensis]|nr:hypothetical protein I3843_02G040000 [Carya illinoinensis]